MRRRWPPHRPHSLAALLMVAALGACASDPTLTLTPACPTAAPTAQEATTILADASRAVVVTSRGEFTIGLDPASAPIAVANFVALARCGYYAGVTFHRVIPGFVAQAGDPQTKANRDDFEGLGGGGPGYRFEVELPEPSFRYVRYVVAMANGLRYDSYTREILSGADTNGSQFFVMLADTPAMPPYYSPLGRVVAGTDVVDAIGLVPTSQRDLPLDPVIIEQIRIEGAAQPS